MLIHILVRREPVFLGLSVLLHSSRSDDDFGNDLGYHICPKYLDHLTSLMRTSPFNYPLMYLKLLDEKQTV